MLFHTSLEPLFSPPKLQKPPYTEDLELPPESEGISRALFPAGDASEAESPHNRRNHSPLLHESTTVDFEIFFSPVHIPLCPAHSQ